MFDNMAKKKVLRFSSPINNAQTIFFIENFVVPLSLCGTTLLMKLAEQTMNREEINAECGRAFTRDLIDTGLKELFGKEYITQRGTSLHGGVQEYIITKKGVIAAGKVNAINNNNMIAAKVAYVDLYGMLQLS